MLQIRTMTAADIPLGLRLKSQAGWNQIAADWQRMLAMQPDGCFVAELDGIAVGTSVACIFGSVAWIAMVLVEESVRGRGIGKALMQHALEFVDQSGVASVRLDATPLGQPLYERLGFLPQYALTRFAGCASEAKRSDVQLDVRLAQSADVQPILELDYAVTGADRRRLLLRLLHEQPQRSQVAFWGEQLAGFITVRPGSNAWQIGPCIAQSDVGPTLMRRACGQVVGEALLIDIPEPNKPATQWAVDAGLQRQRRLLRMCRGAMVSDDISCLWASSGPELG
jgi:predicted N-acetyltransferase YhbS